MRRAKISDVPLLIEHRVGMWRDIGGRTPAELRRHIRAYRDWLVPRMRNGSIVAFIAESHDGAALGSGCVWFAPEHPRPALKDLAIPYVHSMFTEPSARGQGVASAVVRAMIVHCRRAGFQRMSLHAAPAAMSVYHRLGFRPTSEMRLWLDPRLARRFGSRQGFLRGIPTRAKRPGLRQ